MKFIIDSKVFKNITERAAVVCLKKGLANVTSLLISADKEKQRVIVKSTNLNSFVEVFTDDVRVEEDGKVFVDINNIKRLYNVVGEITVETTENSIRVRGNKKQSETLAIADLDEISFPEIVSDKAFFADKDEMLETFSRLSCCLSSDGKKTLYTGFNVAVNNYGRERIVSCDGLRAGIRNVEWNFKHDLNITIPGYIVKELSKVSKNNQKENVEVFSNSKYAWFVGTDFVYTTRLLEGNYIRIEDIAKNEGFTYGFEISSDELGSVSKEYSGILKSFKEPMYFCNVDGKLVAVAMSKDYKTSDVLDVTNAHDVPENLICAINPMYINQMSGVFNKQNIVVTVDLNKSFAPWIFTGESDYTGLILPCRPKEDLSDIRQFVQNM